MRCRVRTTSRPVPLHAAIIMDGNGRWAAARGLPRAAGHRAGAWTIRRVVRAAPRLGVGTLTLYAFSSNNWGRPANEVAGLMRLFEDFFRTEKQEWQRVGVRMSAIGRRDRLPPTLSNEIEAAESFTRYGKRLHLRLAVDYSAQEAILEAARRSSEIQPVTRADFARLLAEVVHASADDPVVDFLIRTGNEQRLSDFLLWELAYAELFFVPRYWPDFEPKDLEQAVEEFKQRDRRFGCLHPELAPSAFQDLPALIQS